jgi:hypothetical protein
VEDLVGIFRQLEAVRLAVAVEQADLHLAGVGGEDREVGAVAAPMGAQRIGQAFLDDEIGHENPPGPDGRDGNAIAS